jgi:hypothetical protein
MPDWENLKGADMFGLLNMEKFWVLPVILLVFQGSCTSPSHPESKSQVVSLLAQADGPVSIKREGWKDFQPAGFGSLVWPTDLLKTDGKIVLVCADLQTVKTFSGTGRNPCPLSNGEIILKYDEMWFSSVRRGGSADEIPSIISPRNTTIFDPNPILKWEDTGAKSYTIEVTQSGETVWENANVTGTELVYPTDAEKLIAGKDYLLIITDNDSGKSSSEDIEKGLGFQVAGGEDRERIVRQREIINNLPELDEDGRNFALAMYDANVRIGGRGPWEDSYLLLEKLSRSNPNEPAIFLRLGDVLAKMKRWDEAEAAYTSALTQSESRGDLESKADALASLWRINPSGQSNYDDALKLYQLIGETAKAAQLEAEKP